MPHGMLDPWFQTEPSRWLKSIRNWTYWKLIESTTIQNADGVLFTSEEEMTLARATFSPYKPKKEINVGYGIEAPPEFSMSMMEAFYMRSPQVENKKYWLFLSRIHPKKGLDILIKAYTILAEKDEYKNHLPDMVIAGPGMETSFGRKVKKKVHNNQTLISKVHFVGMLTGAAKWGAIYGCDAFVLPSHQENFSIAVVEAMACSNAVLISNQVNIWREIQSGGGGIIAEDNINGVVQQLQQFLQLDPILRSKMRFNARNTFENHFIVANAAKQLFNTIKA
jgi:glycosyltransferase involved in cell wall biosynthesis